MNAGRSRWLLGLLGLILVVGSGSVWFVSGQFSSIVQVLGLFGLLAVGAWLYADRAAIQAGTTAREVSVNAAAVLVVVLAGALALLVGGLTERWDQSFDLTRSGRYSLSERSRTVLGGLEQDVQIYALFRKGTPPQESFERLGDLMKGASGRVKIEQIDPLMLPARAAAVVQSTGQAEMDRLAESGTLILNVGTRRRRIESKFDEESIINAVVKLTRGEDTRVCWSVGHGERSPDDDQSVDGYGVTALRLEDRNFVITEQRILTSGVDRACKSLVIAGPVRDLTERELEAVAGYVVEGGQVLVLLDNPRMEQSETPALDADLLRYGIQVADDVIIENSPSNITLDEQNEPLMVYASSDFKVHPSLTGLPAGIAVRWPRSARAAPDFSGVEIREIISSSAQSWADLNWDPASETPPTADPDEPVAAVPFVVVSEIRDPLTLRVTPGATPATPDPASPAVLAASASLVPADLSPKPGGRVVVIGDADLGGNALTNALDNGNLILNMVSFLSGDEAQIGADPKQNETMVWTGFQFALVGLVGVVLVPGAAALAGAIVVLRRRFL